MAWSRVAKRWGELTSPASRTDPALVGAASEVRAAIAAAATNPTGWATPDQLASRLDLPETVKTLHLSMVASVDIAYVVRDTAADHPGLTAPARIIGMRAQGEAEIAIEQGETRYEGVTWTTRSQIAANQLIPLPEPARRGLINLADDVIATTNQAVAAAAQLHPSDVKGANRSGPEAHRGRSAETLQITRPHDPAPRATQMKCTKPVPAGPFARETLILMRRGGHSANSSLSCKMAHGYTAGRSRMPCPLRSWRWSVSIVPSPGYVADTGIAGRFRFHHLCNRRSRLAGSSGASRGG